MRKVSADLTEVEMYASELRLENGSDEVSRFTVKNASWPPIPSGKSKQGRGHCRGVSATGWLSLTLIWNPAKGR